MVKCQRVFVSFIRNINIQMHVNDVAAIAMEPGGDTHKELSSSSHHHPEPPIIHSVWRSDLFAPLLPLHVGEPFFDGRVGVSTLRTARIFRTI